MCIDFYGYITYMLKNFEFCTYCELYMNNLKKLETVFETNA
jgi:hypothetical protein